MERGVNEIEKALNWGWIIKKEDLPKGPPPTIQRLNCVVWEWVLMKRS